MANKIQFLFDGGTQKTFSLLKTYRDMDINDRDVMWNLEESSFVMEYDTVGKRFSVSIEFGYWGWNSQDYAKLNDQLPEICAQFFGIAINEHNTWYDSNDELIFLLTV